MRYGIVVPERDLRDLSSREAAVRNWPGWVQRAILSAAAGTSGEPTDKVDASVTVGSLADELAVTVRVVRRPVGVEAVQDRAPVDPGAPASLRSVAREGGDEAAAVAYEVATGRAAA